MGEFFGIVIFFVIIVVTAVLFFGWVVFMFFRVLFSGIAWAFGVPRSMMTHSATTLRCPQHGCAAINPLTARFCRRCGRALPGAQHVQVRRAAVW